MFYLFNYTSGNTQKHLRPRYNKASPTRFATAKEMVLYLASIYVNPNIIRNARYDYNALLMKSS